MRIQRFFFILILILLLYVVAWAQPVGSIRGVVYDKDFDAPLGGAQVLIAETEQSATVSDEGNYVINEVAAGAYTLVFSKEGYTRQVKADVVVSSGQMTELDIWLSGEFTDMEEFVVQDVEIGGATETALLELRMESPALMDSISSDLMSKAGAGDAASALKLVSGATVQDGKYATIRGLPDRYVNSQMNGVRLPTADAEKRAVQLDQFPSAVIESIQVTKTFTPDQQGDASGGAVNVVLKGVPDERVFKMGLQYSVNENVKDAGSDFLSYKGGGVDTWGRDDGSRDIQFDRIGQSWDGAVGPSSDDAPTDYKWSLALGDKFDFGDYKIGAFGSFFYERDSSYREGVDDKFWVDTWDFFFQDAPYTPSPRYSGGGPVDHEDPWVTSLYDIKQGSEFVQWGGLGVLGFETENHSIDLLYMYTRDAEDKATLAENTRGREGLNKYWDFFYPDEFDDIPFYEVLPGTDFSDEPYNNASIPRRNETLQYTERTTQTLQLHGEHTFDDIDIGLDIEDILIFLQPELDWTIAQSSSTLYQPDKRLFSTIWYPSGATSAHLPYVSGSSYVLGNLQRIWKDISEDSDQYFINLKLPFEQWTGDEGYLKFGLFHDKITREYKQDSFSNMADIGNLYRSGWDDRWSQYWPDDPDREIDEAPVDVDYDADQQISAWYYMIDIPLNSRFNVIGGARFEDTELSIINYPDLDENGNSTVNWYPDDTGNPSALNPGDADVAFEQSDILPSIGFEFELLENVTLRASYSETVARQTFKELSPIMQVEYLGGNVFIGNPDLQMSSLKNYDMRFDWRPYDSGLVSASWFHKDVTDPIEYVAKQASGFEYTNPVNYPEGELTGWEFEVRQEIGHFWEEFEGLSLGANLTLIDSEVTLTEYEAQRLEGLDVPEYTRDMTNAPERLYNIFATYNLDKHGLPGTDLGLFYTVRGDTLVRGAGRDGDRYIPSVYETEYGTLNFFLSYKLNDIWKLKFQAKNLLDPDIETVYRSKYITGDVTKTSYKKGMEFSVSLGAKF